MKNLKLISLVGAMLATGAAISTVQAEEYDIDCKLILCLAGGFPSGCSDAYDYMIDRLKDFKPPIGVCIMSDGDSYDALDVDAHSLSGESSYYCESPLNLYYNVEDDGGHKTTTAFCYSHTERKRARDDDGWTWKTVYVGKISAKRVNFYAHVTVEPGTSEAYSSPEYLINTGTGFVIQK